MLPSGTYVPRDITSKFLCNCVNKWHRKNPNQLGAATLIHTINKHILDRQKSPSSSVYQLTATDRIAVLEAELYNLQARRQNFPPYPNRTHAQKARNANVEIENDEEAAAATRARPPRVEEVIDREETAQSQARLAQNDPPYIDNYSTLQCPQTPILTCKGCSIHTCDQQECRNSR